MARILNIVTNQGTYGDSDTPTGLWLGELTHFYDLFEAHGFEQEIASPTGGPSPLDPRSLGRLSADRSVRRRLEDQAFMALLSKRLPAGDLNWSDYEAIYFTGGHGTMWDVDTGLCVGQDVKKLGKIPSRTGPLPAACRSDSPGCCWARSSSLPLRPRCSPVVTSASGDGERAVTRAQAPLRQEQIRGLTSHEARDASIGKGPPFFPTAGVTTSCASSSAR
jgi:hypothetical protein